MSGPGSLPRAFRKLPVARRRAALEQALGLAGASGPGVLAQDDPDDLADVMIEHALGFAAVPLGVAIGFLVDDEEVLVPMATEEPSVIAASSYAARIVSASGGFRTWAAAPVLAAHVYLRGVDAAGAERLEGAELEVRSALQTLLRGMASRGGGLRGFGVRRLSADLVRAEIRVDVRDAMGANLLNSAAEILRAPLESLTGGKVLMGILSNAAADRRAGAAFSLAVDHLGPACPAGMDALTFAERIVAGAEVAGLDPERAVTHNKGIMNGVSALALATGNDTRALEAAAHAWAARTGSYVGLTRYRLRAAPERLLEGELEMPLPLGVVGGSVGLTSASEAALRILGRPTGVRLARIAAAVGLAQNLAALMALCGGGIQQGHLVLHARRLAWVAGARGPEIGPLAEILAREMSTAGGVGPDRARELLSQMRARSR